MNGKAFLLAAFILSGCGGCGNVVVEVVPVPPGDAARGREVFLKTCRECHGVDAKGIPGAGDNLTVSTFIPSKSDAELVAFVKTGRMMNDPMNKTGIAMPPYGSNPELTDQEIVDAITYIRSLAVELQTATNGSDE